MDNYMGIRIRQKRLEKGMTMEDLAAKLDVGKSAVNKWEKGHITNIKRPTIEKMAQLFECSPSWLMGWSEDEPPAILEDDDSEIKRLYEMYQKATPEVRSAVETLLKSATK